MYDRQLDLSLKRERSTADAQFDMITATPDRPSRLCGRDGKIQSYKK